VNAESNQLSPRWGRGNRVASSDYKTRREDEKCGDSLQPLDQAREGQVVRERVFEK